MYDPNPLYAPADGSGQTVGIVTLAAVDPGAPEYFWARSRTRTAPASSSSTTSTAARARRSAASGSIETDLDIEQSGALAPGAN